MPQWLEAIPRRLTLVGCVAGLQHLRDVTDPEHPYTLEQLSVVTEELIDVSDEDSYVRCVLSHDMKLDVYLCSAVAGTGRPSL